LFSFAGSLREQRRACHQLDSDVGENNAARADGMIANNAVTRAATNLRRSTKDSDLATRTAVDEGRRVSWHV
jgi:hypothetical protein